MKRFFIALVLALICTAARAQQPVLPGFNVCSTTATGSTQCGWVATDRTNPLPVIMGTQNVISGNAAGTTSAVVGTLAASTTKFTYICGFNVQSIGGTASSGPITIAGLVGGSQVYQTDVNSATVGKTIASATFTPCIPSSAINTAITVTTTANGTASAVDVNSWGYTQ